MRADTNAPVSLTTISRPTSPSMPAASASGVYFGSTNAILRALAPRGATGVRATSWVGGATVVTDVDVGSTAFTVIAKWAEGALVAATTGAAAGMSLVLVLVPAARCSMRDSRRRGAGATGCGRSSVGATTGSLGASIGISSTVTATSDVAPDEVASAP